MKRIKADWLESSATRAMFALLSDYECYAVGGCIRNTLLDHPVNDIDLSTDARPEVVMELAEAAGLHAIPTGLEHGTVTVVVEDTPFEVTTFRKDIETDGRRAVVAFANSVEDDALRRDFTMNALYARGDGEVIDPVDGLPDIATRTVRFIEDADRRIQEDYLRSLRFFRFSAWYADMERGFDPVALDAIGRNLAGLETLSRERVGSELVKLLSAPDPAPAVATMRSVGVLAQVLPGASDENLGLLVALEERFGLPADAVRRLALLGGDFDSLRLSRAQARDVHRIRDNTGQDARRLGYRLGLKLGADALLVTAASLGQDLPADALDGISFGAAQTFPVFAADLMPEYEGKALGDKLRALENTWIESGFTLLKEELLSEG
ncbi:MAG: CCA tRNA nucleotidyltransferase [Paracoccaceae bacterium]|nr:CCA tRNA nucleotidyltransferase [Paracoccaceae bacterium]